MKVALGGRGRGAKVCEGFGKHVNGIDITRPSTTSRNPMPVGVSHDLPNLATFHLVHPAGYMNILRDCLAALQELDVIPDARLEMAKGLEIQASELLLRFSSKLLLYHSMSVFILAIPSVEVSVAHSDLEDEAASLGRSEAF